LNWNGVVCAQETASLLSSKLDIYVYVVDGILIDTGPSRFAERYKSFFNSQRGKFFTGDLFVTPKPKIIMKTKCIPEIMCSLEVLLQKDFQTVYCGHAGVIEDGKTMIAKKLDFLNNLKMEVLQLYRKG